MVNDNNGLVYPIPDSTTESFIQKTIEGIQRRISLHNNQVGKEKGITTTTTKEVIEISLASKRH